MQGNEVVPRQYAYLDQNIIIYARDEIKKGSTDAPLFKAISKLKNQGAIFPYSQAHLLDFFANDLEGKGPYASTDFCILSNISDNNMLGTTWENNKVLLLLAKCPPREALAMGGLGDGLSAAVPHFDPFPVDMSQVPSDHPFYEILVNNGGIFSWSILEDYLNSLSDDIDKLKAFNKSLKDGHSALGNIPQGLSCFLDATTREEDYIRDNFFDILNLFFKSKGMRYEKSDLSKLPDAYWVLNQCTGFRDKVSKKNNINNTNSDGLHFFYAHKARYLISSDAAFLKKCNFLIDFYDLPVKAISKDDFLLI